jgi:hypothetical protein
MKKLTIIWKRRIDDTIYLEKDHTALTWEARGRWLFVSDIHCRLEIIPIDEILRIQGENVDK